MLEMEIFRDFCCSPPLGTMGEGMFVSASSLAELIFRFAQVFCFARHSLSKLNSALAYRKKSLAVKYS